MSPESTQLRLPIASQAIEVALSFAQEQPTLERQERVQLNTLAVYAIDYYLDLMGFETNLRGGDSWNPIARMCSDVADLEVINIGKLECRPVRVGETEYSIPAEVWIDRVGYIFVEIDLAERFATILGFVAQARPIVSRDLLRSSLHFIDHLHGLMTSPVVQLDRWFEDLESAIATGWKFKEQLASLFTTSEYAYRSAINLTNFNSIKGGKVLDLGIQFEGYPIALIVELSPVESSERSSIYLKVCPTQQLYLLPNIQLIVRDESKQTFLEAQSRTADNLIQLEFTGAIGEKFDVVVKRGDAEITENFII